MEKNYYAIIPANVRYDKDLTPNAKLLYGEITALCNEKGYCWAGNSYFSELYKVSKKSISTWINQLSSKGYITSEIKYKEGTKEILHRYLRIVHGGVEENVNTPMEEKVKDNITVINNTSNNTSNISIPYSEIIDYLNQKAKTKYRASSKKTKELIKARWNEEFTLEDFKTVIDKKTKEWLTDTKMKNYLRPETLFGTKFESYLNQKGSGKSGFDWDAFEEEDASNIDFGF
ncbi:alpha/beta hydrolase [Rossellomorea vietnamensis]|uniref:Alpha/beta hydrolase n=1 Tax=Rossellomorea vietnamensis TaxID=218284 RepID=A0A5D4KDX5_9BACI|nr:conserved phage C-terminal domain-containing protein [Rossellomorea vietnamensis]TYR75557.1 alpha/beta hydrolase [Rossellomorea vietnamensis]